MNAAHAELIALRANLVAQYDAADLWLKQAAQDPHCKPEQLQVQHVRMMSRAYVSFKNALANLEEARS